MSFAISEERKGKQARSIFARALSALFGLLKRADRPVYMTSDEWKVKRRAAILDLKARKRGRR